MRRDRHDDDDFPQVTFTPKLIASVCALEGGGKTEFLCGAQEPITIVSVDPNTAEVVEKAQRAGRKVRLHEFEMPGVAFGDKRDVQDDAAAIWEGIGEVLTPIIRREKTVGTVGLDTATELFELALLADHGRSVQILPEMRTKSNYKFKSLINSLKRSGCNVLLLNRLRDRYENRKVRTRDGLEEQRVKIEGEYERDGFSKTGFIVNVEAFLFYDAARDKDERWGMRVQRCTNRPWLIGKEYWGEREQDGETIRASSFESLATLVYKHTTLNDWR